MFDLKLDYIAAWIRDGGYASVALQFPEGLRIRSMEIIDFLTSETDAHFTILGDPCYGACDLFMDYRKIADALVHFGHSEMPCVGHDPDVLYIEAFRETDMSGIAACADRLPTKVGLLATVQYIKGLPQVKGILESLGKKCVIAEGDSRTLYPGQVLGCDCSVAENASSEVDGFLFIGEGDFHPLAAAFGVGKEILVYNPITCELRSVNDVRDRILRKRFAAIESARSAESFLVIVCGKVGQNRAALADELVSAIEEVGKKAYVTFMNELAPQNLLAYRVDAFVNTACPRIAMDDYSRYDKPILTPTELEIVLGKRTWDEYAFDVIRP